MDSHLIPLPSLLPHPDYVVGFLPPEVWKDGVVGEEKVFSPTTSPLTYTLLGTSRDWDGGLTKLH